MHPSLLSYVINCEGHKERLRTFLKFARKAGFSPTRIPCKEARYITERVICRMESKGELKLEAKLTPTEIAIFLSHRSAWKRLLSSKKKYALILEDDSHVFVSFVDNIRTVLSGLEKVRIPFDVLWLWNGDWASTKSKLKFVTDIGPFKIMEETREYNAGAVGYIITRAFAKRLVASSFPITSPVDIFIADRMYDRESKKHLTLDMDVYKNGCVKSPVLRTGCGGEYGTGKNTTQKYKAKSTDKIQC